MSNPKAKVFRTKKIMWTTIHLFKKAIKGAYLDYYGENISDECVRRIIKWHKEQLTALEEHGK